MLCFVIFKKILEYRYIANFAFGFRSQTMNGKLPKQTIKMLSVITLLPTPYQCTKPFSTFLNNKQ